MAFGEHLVEFVANALTADLANICCESLDGGKSLGLNFVAQAGCKTDCAQHAQFVFGESLLRIADGANDVVFQVGLTMNVVEDLFLDGIEQQPVDGEVAPLDIFLGRLGKAHLIGMPSVGIANIATICGHFNFEGLRTILRTDDHQDYAELSAYGNAIREDA